MFGADWPASGRRPVGVPDGRGSNPLPLGSGLRAASALSELETGVAELVRVRRFLKSHDFQLPQNLRLTRH